MKRINMCKHIWKKYLASHFKIPLNFISQLCSASKFHSNAKSTLCSALWLTFPEESLCNKWSSILTTGLFFFYLMLFTAIFITVIDWTYGMLLLRSQRVVSATSTDGRQDWQFVSGVQTSATGAVSERDSRQCLMVHNNRCVIQKWNTVSCMNNHIMRKRRVLCHYLHIWLYKYHTNAEIWLNPLGFLPVYLLFHFMWSCTPCCSARTPTAMCVTDACLWRQGICYQVA